MCARPGRRSVRKPGSPSEETFAREGHMSVLHAEPGSPSEETFAREGHMSVLHAVADAWGSSGRYSFLLGG